MRTYCLEAAGREIPVYETEAVIVGSGCAGFNAADWLYDLNLRDIVLVTEGRNAGTSRNTGSDKQTYYKLSLASDGFDSVQEMAETLFSGGGVHGDNALAEAAGSVKCFFKLVNLGVPFPTNQYGEYVGYKTDHDPRQRATSAGPLTSKFMTECLERSVLRKGIQIDDNIQLISLLVKKGELLGALAIDLAHMEQENRGLRIYHCKYLLAATGGPAAVYGASVFPESQTGNTGMFLEAGARGANLQSWQFGLASIKFRWNVSGTYQQVLPRYISIDSEGQEREFLNDYFHNPFEAVDMTFLKGYQWPFDTAKLNGSSVIDIIVHHETMVKGRHVYMDFTRNPSCIECQGFEGLADAAKEYLSNSGALFGTPIERLKKMNQPAIELYSTHGINLAMEPLEVAICAQHCNGGIAVDSNWQTDIRRLYVAGEAAGTFGIHRPGGSALNSSQVGSMRAAEHMVYDAPKDFAPGFVEKAAEAAEKFYNIEKELQKREKQGIGAAFAQSRQLMSKYAAHISSKEGLKTAADEISRRLSEGTSGVSLEKGENVAQYYKYIDTLKTQMAILSAAAFSADCYGSRGSSMVASAQGVKTAAAEYTYEPAKNETENCVLLTEYKKGSCSSYLEPVRPIPKREGWFETVWNEYQQRRQQDDYHRQEQR